ncbi:TetR/AcrR family transcriptional regulator [Candidatus Contubernalis alkaliaceticus]|uniref:TetR/AcrR family transcriptional regulator n=1 Tax=Candidatus Contubernalis alkaliaceticus TaxID=338645 RepID=UPI001F4BF340|nr:TetR/AcrR family transcriptional regulator [Candidatus Contubernalis alkalaceticus]UNC93210.1 TetR/AcrR family transcriptional regulator [Candidatus Contubernalis alkalaceticus]
MPKETFNNLPEEKKNFIIQIATDEFYEYGYEKSSISRIVEMSGIAKGSFYQYFEGKEDLFRFIMTMASEKKLEYLNDLISNLNNMDLFKLLRALFLGSLVFQKDNPKLSGLTDRFLKNANSKLKEIILGDSKKNSNLFLENLLLQDIARNEIRSDLNISFTAHLITGIAVSLSDYMRDRFEDMDKLDENMYENLVDESIKLLKEGIQQKSQI